MDNAARGPARGEIQALLESPELRRIFEEEPGASAAARAARSRARRGNVFETHDGLDTSPPPSRQGTRKSRILIGLAPLYLGAIILFFETVREPSTILQFFGTPSVAEETASRTGRINLAATSGTVTDSAVQRDAAQSDASATQPPTVAPAAGADTIEAETTLADAPASTESEEAGTELAMRSAEAAPEGAPAATDRAPVGGSPGEGTTGESSAGASTIYAADGPFGDSAYPDPRAGIPVAEPIDPAVAEAAEEALRLSRAERREVQRRLRLAEADPKMIDGIFGPATRAAITAWQEQAGLPATGFLDEPAMAMLVEQTAEEYRAWRVAERARAREREEQSAVVVSSVPPVSSASRDDTCRRLPSGELAFGKDVGCNFRAFGQNLKRDFKDLKGNLRQLFD